MSLNTFHYNILSFSYYEIMIINRLILVYSSLLALCFPFHAHLFIIFCSALLQRPVRAARVGASDARHVVQLEAASARQDSLRSEQPTCVYSRSCLLTFDSVIELILHIRTRYNL